MTEAVPEKPIVLGNYSLDSLDFRGRAVYVRNDYWKGKYSEAKRSELAKSIFKHLKESGYETRDLGTAECHISSNEVKGPARSLREAERRLEYPNGVSVCVHPDTIEVNPNPVLLGILASGILDEKQLKSFKKLLQKIDEVLIEEAK